MELPAFLQTMPDEFLIVGFFVFLLIYSFSLPITEEIALILVGLMAHARNCSFGIIFLAAFPGIFGSDIVYYTVAKYFGFRLLSSKILENSLNQRKYSRVNGTLNGEVLVLHFSAVSLWVSVLRQ